MSGITNRYIDRELAMRIIARQVNNTKQYKWRQILVTMGNYINDLPTADVRKNVKGKWLEDRVGVKCSVCNVGQAYEENFCPNCGADMGRLQ